MGADIHIYAERKLSDGTWAMCKSFEGQSSSQFDSRVKVLERKTLFTRARMRNYNFFADLAGVRGDGPDHKGFPNDASPLVQEEFDRWNTDAHTPSWYSAREFVPIFMKNWMSDEESAELVSNRLSSSSVSSEIVFNVLETYLGVDVPYDDDDNPNVDAIRFVFWFDN
jgi:hypothetical protein